MEIAKIRGQPRIPGGRHANERLRRSGLVPAIIYGHDQPPEPVALSRHDLLLALQDLTHVVQLEINGRKTQYLLKEVQFDHLHKEPIHVDLMRVDPNERVRVKVAVELKGEPRGIHEGGEMVHLIADLEVECPLLAIPEVITHNVRELGLNQALHVKDLELPPGVRALHDADEIVAIVRPRRGVTVAEAAAPAAVEAAAPSEPEVISKGKEEKEGEGGEQP